jgi:hypothetical protein
MKEIKNFTKLSPEASAKMKKRLEEKNIRVDNMRKAFNELKEGVDYKMVETDIGKGNPNIYPVRKMIPLSEKGEDFLKGKY